MSVLITISNLNSHFDDKIAIVPVDAARNFHAKIRPFLNHHSLLQDNDDLEVTCRNEHDFDKLLELLDRSINDATQTQT